MMFIASNQLELLLSLFVVGAIGTAFLFRKPAGHSAWKFADLVWVVLGGIGALVAIVAGLYTADSSRLDRQIDLAYSATAAFDRDAARFRLRFCETASTTNMMTLCEKVEFLSASTAANSDLPLFIAVTDEVAPLAGLSFLFGNRGAEKSAGEDDMRQMVGRLEAFDVERFLVFAALDDKTKEAVEKTRLAAPSIAADYLIIAQSYDDLIEQVGKLKDEWEYLQSHSSILVLQILALCLVSFAAPFRLGKSIVEVRASMMRR
ncbi:hypothetical protein MUY35_02440 [Aliiroseovarius sp. S1339]|uniref:hypothetical protein n=1 Tax=Aliiroseovarius sp. S1339 TaxID=2936990 RepID=UPI0020C0EA2E|nr:hypothetical protein [Aliiroseovarius sp. S1339]MCK8462704.1 hypothetical protein [Aliiroseovarius sp. S1339]